MPPDALNDQYLADTPFHDLFSTAVPLRLTHDDRFSHTHIIGGTGSGKTTLIENLILHDIAADDPTAIADAILQLVARPERAMDLRSAGLVLASTHTRPAEATRLVGRWQLRWPELPWG